ncbi:MAG: hypothetical protein MUP61_00255 [Burkholderiales bacterium]|nr:hypothetical protein [Burkholderiales bacterium]MCJ7837631.1 hypothetical protein [Burkholderiales bacterium]
MKSDAAPEKLGELQARLILIADMRESGEVGAVFAGAGLARTVKFASYRNGSAFLVGNDERA